MNERDQDPFGAGELKLIESARRGLEPSAEDAARVLNGARLAIAAGAPAGLPPSVPDAPTLEPSTIAASSKLAALAPKLLAALVIAGVSAGIGYKLGVREGAEQARARSVPSPVSADESTHRSAIAEASSLPHAQAPAVANALPVPVSVEVMPSVVPDAGIARVRPRRTKPIVAELAANAPAQAEAEDEPSAMQSLDPEVRALKQIERALRRREPERALTLLQQLDRQVPTGKLTEERAAAFAMARCDLGIGTPMAHALEFSQRYPASVYFTRVRQTCTPATDSGVR